MKKQFIALATVFTLLSFNAEANSIAVLDVEKIVKESKAMRYIQKEVTKQQESYQEEVNAKQKDLEKEQTRIESKKAVLSSEAFAKEMKAFEEKVNELKELVDKKRLVNSVYAYNMENIDPALFIFMATCNPGVKAEEVEKELIKQIEFIVNLFNII